MNKTDLKLYAITDRQWLHGARLSEHVKLAIEGGATMIQICDKDILSTDSDAGLKDEYSEALEIKRICHEHKVPLIINDNVQFAIDIAADGVHLGQDDMNPAEARKLLGTDKIIGVTAKTVEQAKRAEADGADYLGSGAVFGSTTKLNAKPMTKELLREITSCCFDSGCCNRRHKCRQCGHAKGHRDCRNRSGRSDICKRRYKGCSQGTRRNMR